MKFNRQFFISIIPVLFLHSFFGDGLAAPRAPQFPLPEMSPIIHQETFNAIYEAGISNAEVSLPNYGVLRESWSGYSLQRLGNVTPFVISSLNETGRVQVATDNASVRFWFMPYWSSASTGNGNGPGAVARLLELAAEDKGQAVTLWKLAVNEDGSVLSLIGSGDLGEVVLLKAEIAWRAGEWHQIVLTYGSKGTELVLDGEQVAEGAGTIVVPPKVARLVVGSSWTGEESAGGEMDELFCFSKPLKSAFHYTAFKEQAALGPVTEAELEARAEKLAKRKAELEARKALEGESGGGGMMLRMSGPTASCVTNGPVYLTNVLATLTANDGWTVYFDIAGGTNGVVYDIFSTPELAGNDVTNSVWTWLETGMTCETHYFTNQPTNQMFYVLTVPGADRDGDGMYDGWEWKHFGTLAQPAEGDFDGDGIWNVDEFSGGSDPNTIQFYTLFDNLRVNGNSLTGTVTLLAGVPAKIAVQGTTNFASASWRTYNASFTASIGTSDGAYPVYVGLKGMAETSEVTWAGYHLTRDTTAPMIVITNPLAGVVFQPMLQLQGYSPEPLASVRYDITNTSGSLTNMEGYVVKQFVDTNTFEITTNWFACVDLNLAAGTNTVTLKATDRAGNVTTTNLHYVFVYPTNAPVLSLVWPQDGDLLSGTSFTVRGRLSDPTAQVTAEAVGNGVTHSMTGVVERDGKFWIENMPLAAGANEVTISVVDAGTNSTGTNFTVVKSGVELTIDPLNSSELNNPYITVYGSINVSTHKIWVNGMEVTNVSSGNWYVEGVPLNEGGTAVVQARAIPLTDNGGNGTGGSGGQNTTFDDPGNPDSPSDITTEADLDKNPEVVMVHYEKNRSYLSLTRAEYPTKKQTKEIIRWDVQQPGSWFDDDCDGNTFGSHMYYTYTRRNWESNGVGVLKSNTDRGGPEVCGVQLYDAGTPYTMTETWPGESCGTTGYRVPAGGGVDQVVARTARTLYELHTGGKKLSGRGGLFMLSGSAEGAGNPFWPEDDTDKKGFVIPKTQIELGSFGRLDSDGHIYKAIADGETSDITPTVAGNPYYTHGQPGQTKGLVALSLNTSGENLSPGDNLHFPTEMFDVSNPFGVPEDQLGKVTPNSPLGCVGYFGKVEIIGNVPFVPPAGFGLFTFKQERVAYLYVTYSNRGPQTTTYNDIEVLTEGQDAQGTPDTYYGKIFAIDGPGIPSGLYPAITSIWERQNFSTWVECGGFKVSNNLAWHTQTTVTNGLSIPTDVGTGHVDLH